MNPSRTSTARGDLWFRARLSGIFVVAGLQHLVRSAAVTAHLVHSPFGAALASRIAVGPLIGAAGIVLLAGGVALLLGVRTRLAVLALAGAEACAPRATERAPATDARQASDGVVLLVQTPQHLDVALLTARELVASNEAREVRVLACGPAVSALRVDGLAAAKVAERDRAHVRVLACGLSLERAGIAPSALAPELEVVPNGIVEVLRLQRAGFRSVEL